VSALSAASPFKQRPLRYADVRLFNWRVLRAVSGASADKLYVVSSSESDQCSRLRMVRPVSEANASNCSDVTAYVWSCRPLRPENFRHPFGSFGMVQVVRRSSFTHIVDINPSCISCQPLHTPLITADTSGLHPCVHRPNGTDV
jgi:hypothetical protein